MQTESVGRRVQLKDLISAALNSCQRLLCTNEINPKMPQSRKKLMKRLFQCKIIISRLYATALFTRSQGYSLFSKSEENLKNDLNFYVVSKLKSLQRKKEKGKESILLKTENDLFKITSSKSENIQVLQRFNEFFTFYNPSKETVVKFHDRYLSIYHRGKFSFYANHFLLTGPKEIS